MDGAKILEVVGVYRNFFKERGIRTAVSSDLRINSDEITEAMRTYYGYFKKNKIGMIDFPHDDMPGSKEEILAHCHGMLPKMTEFLKEDRTEKVRRWFGFIQGCLWSTDQRQSDEEILARCHNLIDEVEGFARDGHKDEAFVYLGFVQGCLWSTRQYSLTNLQSHNRP